MLGFFATELGSVFSEHKVYRCMKFNHSLLYTSVSDIVNQRILYLSQ